MNTDHPLAIEFRRAVEAADPVAIRRLLDEHAELREVVDSPWFAFATPALVHLVPSGNRDAIDALLDAGADIDAKSHWDAGPYGALDRIVDSRDVDDELAEYLIGRGAFLDLHAASGLGRIDTLRVLLDAAPERINEAGPDGATALHLARTVEVAEFLLARGADIEQRCVDHKSTPIMWSTQGREDVTRYLAERGARTDLFTAAVLNDLQMVRDILDREPDAIEVRVRYGESHPHIGFGDKYVWALDFAETPLEVARRRGHTEVFNLLSSHSTAATRLIMACRSANLAEVARLLADADLVSTLTEAETCAALSSTTEAAALVLQAGANPNPRDDDTGATPLHHASWKNDRPRVDLLLSHGADPELKDHTYEATPLQWAIHNGHNDLGEILGT